MLILFRPESFGTDILRVLATVVKLNKCNYVACNAFKCFFELHAGAGDLQGVVLKERAVAAFAPKMR